MKITQLHTLYRLRGGEDAVIDAEARILEESGHDVDRILFHNPESNLAAIPTLLMAPWNLSAGARTGQALLANPDVVHIHNTWFAAGPSAIRAAHRAAPVVITFHNFRVACANSLLYRQQKPCLDCVGNSGLAGIRHRCYRDSAAASALVSLTSAVQRWSGIWERQVDQVIAHSDFAADIFQRSGVPANVLQVVDNFTADPGPRALRPSQSDTVIAVSRLSPEKGLDRLIEAWNRSDTGLRLTIIGDGPERSRLQELAKGRVTLTGLLSPQEVSEHMLAARALMFPSRWFESQPLVLLEALASGLVPIASDHPPLRWVLESLGEDVLVADRDESWTDAIALAEADEWVDEKGVAARQLFEQRFSPERARANLERVYRVAIERHQNHHRS